MDNVLERVKSKYPWLKEDEAGELAETALGWFYVLRYPCEPSASFTTHPVETYLDTWAVARICDEIAQRNGFNSALGYRENGVQFTFDAAWISDALRSSIIPIAGVI